MTQQAKILDIPNVLTKRCKNGPRSACHYLKAFWLFTIFSQHVVISEALSPHNNIDSNDCRFHLKQQQQQCATASRREIVTSAARFGSLVAGTCIPISRTLPAWARNLPEPTASLDKSKVGSVETLLPIVTLEQNLIQLKYKITDSMNFEALLQGKDLFSNFPTDEKSFKKLFDAYSDPVSYKQKFLDQNAFLVYYTKGFDGPGRPSIENDLNERQTLQYGSRNDAWVAWDSFLAELDFAKRNPRGSSKEDLLEPLDKTIRAISDYLNQAPAEDLKSAREQQSVR